MKTYWLVFILFWRQIIAMHEIVVGRKFSFSEENADLTTNDDAGVWNGRKGEMEITKVNSNWVEGNLNPGK